MFEVRLMFRYFSKKKKKGIITNFCIYGTFLCSVRISLLVNMKIQSNFNEVISLKI